MHFGISSFSFFLAVVGTSNCNGNSCSQLCLPKANGFNCTCGDDMELIPGSSEQCRCIGGLELLANGTCERKGMTFIFLFIALRNVFIPW